jgi:N-acetylmuramoyl-L-alanine amidase
MAWIMAPMATRYDLGRPLSTTPLTHDIICAHTMVGTLNGSLAGSSQTGSTYWHFGLNAQGHLVQCQDLRYKSAANLEGNWHVIPIETSDRDEGTWPMEWAPRPWTPAQLEKIISLFAWLCVRFDIPPRLIPDTKRGRRGIGYHRQGIDPWRVDGGERWSKSTGKTCPTDPRIAQLTSTVIPRVAALVNPTTPTPEPEPDLLEDDDMIVFRRLSNRSAMTLASGKLVQVTGEEAVDRYKTEGVPVVWLDEDEWGRYTKAYGPVVT